MNHPRQQHKFSDKIQKPKGLCNVCGKLGQKACKCQLRKGQSQPNQKLAKPVAQVNLAKETEIIYAVVEEANMVANSAEWVYDT